jgi:hypothetical protein
VKNENCTLTDLDYGEKTDNHGKWEIHTLGHKYGEENWKSWKISKCPL